MHLKDSRLLMIGCPACWELWEEVCLEGKVSIELTLQGWDEDGRGSAWWKCSCDLASQFYFHQRMCNYLAPSTAIEEPQVLYSPKMFQSWFLLSIFSLCKSVSASSSTSWSCQSFPSTTHISMSASVKYCSHNLRRGGSPPRSQKWRTVEVEGMATSRTVRWQWNERCWSDTK